MANLDLTASEALLPHVLLAKSQKGKAVAAIVQQALSDAKCFVFSELLDLPSVQELEKKDKPTFDTLKLFAYGTLADYKSGKGFLKLNPAQTLKLKRLSLASLAAGSKQLPYARLMKELDVPNVRALEDLVIECVYLGLLSGRLDQRAEILEVSSAFGRDVPASMYSDLLKQLTAWSDTSSGLLKEIDNRLKYIDTVQQERTRHQEEFTTRIESLKKDIKASMDGDGDLRAGDFDSQEYFEEERSSRKRGSIGRSKSGRSMMSSRSRERRDK